MPATKFDFPTLGASEDLAMLTASDYRNRLLLDFRNYGEESASQNSDRGYLLLSGQYNVYTDSGVFGLAPYYAHALITPGNRTDPFYYRIPPDVDSAMSGSGIYQHVQGGPRTSRTKGVLSNPDPIKPLHMIRTSEEAFHTTDSVVTVGHTEIARLKAELPNTSRKRIRLCCHDNANARLHEMFVLYAKEAYVQPNKHLAKDETFLILEGYADFIFYSDSGDVTEIVSLGPPESGKTFFVRVDEGRYHSVVMSSEFLVIHESTPGPYNREHTVWAPWAKSQRLS